MAPTAPRASNHSTRRRGSHRVVIVGAGFAGLRAARRLARRRDVSVTLIDRANHHLFQPLLYQVATGILSPSQIAPPVRDLFARAPNVQVLLADVTDIDVVERTVAARSTGELVVRYDTLLVAAGVGHTYFGRDDWAVYAPGLKSLDDAQRIRTRVLGAFEVAETIGDPRERAAWLTFVVVGGGPTGVELAGQLAFLANRTLAGSYRAIRTEDARIVLVDAGQALLAPFPERLQRAARTELERMGVEVLLQTAAAEISHDRIDLRQHDGEITRLATHNVIWAAGVNASPLAALLAAQTGTPTDRAGRLRVEPDLTLPGHAEVFAIGDIASVDGVPGVAQAAIQQATHAARVIARRLDGRPAQRPFRYRNRGSMAVVGRSWAVADIRGVRVAGRSAWLVWALVHIAFLVGYQNRLETVRRWLWDISSRTRHERAISLDHLVDAAAATMPAADPAPTAS